MNIRFEGSSVRVRVTREEALRLIGEGMLQDIWLTIKTDSPELLIFERQGEGFLFRLPKYQLDNMLETNSLEFVQKGERTLSFEIDRFRRLKTSC